MRETKFWKYTSPALEESLKNALRMHIYSSVPGLQEFHKAFLEVCIGAFSPTIMIGTPKSIRVATNSIPVADGHRWMGVFNEDPIFLYLNGIGFVVNDEIPPNSIFIHNTQHPYDQYLNILLTWKEDLISIG